jgi:hypothetical protein
MSVEASEEGETIITTGELGQYFAMINFDAAKRPGLQSLESPKCLWRAVEEESSHVGNLFRGINPLTGPHRVPPYNILDGFEGGSQSQYRTWVPKANFHAGLNLVLTNVDMTRGNFLPNYIYFVIEPDKHPAVHFPADCLEA